MADGYDEMGPWLCFGLVVGQAVSNLGCGPYERLNKLARRGTDMGGTLNDVAPELRTSVMTVSHVSYSVHPQWIQAARICLVTCSRNCSMVDYKMPEVRCMK